MCMIICFSGKIASGKSSVSEALADKLKWLRISFGDYVRAQVADQGLDPNDRNTLQEYGQMLVERDAEKFCRDVLEFGAFVPGQNLLLDGIRHISIYQQIRDLLVPCQTRLIFLDPGDQERHRRSQERGDQDKILSSEEHAVESELSYAIPDSADLVISSKSELDIIVDECLEHILEWNRQFQSSEAS